MYPFRDLKLHGVTTKPFLHNLMPYKYYETHQLIPNFLNVDELHTNNSKESYELYGLLPESKCDDSPSKNGYLDYFRLTCQEVDYSKITHLRIDYIDRGITSFIFFGNMLKSLFPNLKSLEFDQNFSGESDDVYEEFLNMLKKLQLDNFRLCDTQSRFLKYLKINDIIECMPENSLFVLRRVTSDDINDDELFDKINNNLKKYYEKIGSKEIYIYF
jgi:hypothetical protein